MDIGTIFASIIGAFVGSFLTLIYIRLLKIHSVYKLFYTYRNRIIYHCYNDLLNSYQKNGLFWNENDKKRYDDFYDMMNDFRGYFVDYPFIWDAIYSSNMLTDLNETSIVSKQKLYEYYKSYLSYKITVRELGENGLLSIFITDTNALELHLNTLISNQKYI